MKTAIYQGHEIRLATAHNSSHAYQIHSLSFYPFSSPLSLS